VHAGDNIEVVARDLRICLQWRRRRRKGLVVSAAEFQIVAKLLASNSDRAQRVVIRVKLRDLGDRYRTQPHCSFSGEGGGRSQIGYSGFPFRLQNEVDQRCVLEARGVWRE